MIGMIEMIEMISANAGQTVMIAKETPSCLAGARLQLTGVCGLSAGNGGCYEDTYLSLGEPSRPDKIVAGRYCDKWKQAGFSQFGAVSPGVIALGVWELQRDCSTFRRAFDSPQCLWV